MKNKVLKLRTVILGITGLTAAMTLIVMFFSNVVSSIIGLAMIFCIHRMLDM